MRRLRNVLTLFAAVALGVATVAISGGGSAAAVGNTLQVPSQYPTIQAAVDAANPTGGTIIVQPGTYEESVVITKSNITIKGAPNKPNPVVSPPDDTESGCDDAIDELNGFCIFSFGAPIKNVEIAKLTIQDFPVMGILAFNANGLNFHDNILTNNDEYGIGVFDSAHVKIVSNTASGSEEAGVYIGDSPNASALVRRNTLTDNLFGIFIRDSSHGTISENIATGNCVGILLLDTGSPDLVFDWTLVHNTTDNNTKACPASDEGPAFSGVGILVVGASHTRLTANHATGNVPSGETIGSAGIIVVSAQCFGGADPTYVQVDNSTLGGNFIDIIYDGTGHHNTFFSNGVAPTLIPPITCDGGDS